MNRKATPWISAFIVTLAVAALAHSPAASAQEPAQESIRASSIELLSWGDSLLDWLGEQLNAAWQAINTEGSSESEDSDEPESFNEQDIEDPPTSEVGPGMVPIG